jgi:hypothetical protein
VNLPLLAFTDIDFAALAFKLFRSTINSFFSGEDEFDREFELSVFGGPTDFSTKDVMNVPTQPSPSSSAPPPLLHIPPPPPLLIKENVASEQQRQQQPPKRRFSKEANKEETTATGG